MITRAAVVPSPPLLVPELVPGMEQDTELVRQACLAAVARLAQVTDQWIAVGVGARRAVIATSCRGTLSGYGVDVPVYLSAESGAARASELPLPALLAGWLRERSGARGVRIELLAADTSAHSCLRIGEELAAVNGDIGLLVLGDGSIRHGQRAPGRADPRAAAFDNEIAAALGSADVNALKRVDPELADDLGVAGRAPWQVLAGVVGSKPWDAELLYSGAPFGVGYHVAVWQEGQ